MKTKVLLALGLVLMMVSLYRDFVYVHVKNTMDVMGVLSRIFYLMVPVGWLALLSFFIVFVCSILYLSKKENKWDIIAHSAAEIGIVSTTLALIVGTLWGKGYWGVWWTGEARLTATLILWLIYLAYFLVRSFANEESRGARFAAVIGIVGFVDVPIVAFATSLWRGLHPPPLIFEGGLAPDQALTLMLSIFAYTVVFVVLLILRVYIANNESDIKQLKEQIG